MKNKPHTLTSCSLEEIFSNLKDIGDQINQLMVATDWDPRVVPFTRRIVSDVQQMRTILRQTD